VAEGAGPDVWQDPGAVAPALVRLVSAGVEDSLERFSDLALLAAGKVNVISLEAVEARFGARWALRQDQVYDFANRVLERGVGDRGFVMRVSPTDFFIVQPDLGRVAGQAACLRYLREVLNHFLGESGMAGVGVRQVTKITGGRLEAAAIDERALSEAAAEGDDLDIATAPSPPSAPAKTTVDKWTPFVAADGRQIRVTATLEPVYELKAFKRIGFRMIRRVIVVRTDEELSPQQVATLSTADLLRVDLATIARGVDRLRAESASEQQLSLIVPVSFTSLSSVKGRAEFVKQLAEAGTLVRLGVICEVSDVDGVPASALLAVTSLLRPFALLVVGSITNTVPAAIVRLEGAGLQALAFECPVGLGDAEFIGWATMAIHAAKRVARSVMVYRAASAKRAGILASLGASHASVISE